MNGDCRKQKLNPGHQEDGNPDYSAFSTEQEPASLASKNKMADTMCSFCE